MKLHIVNRTENEQNGTFTLWVGDADDDAAPVSMYHYPSDVPEHMVGKLTAEDWSAQCAAHAIGLEGTARGVTSPREPLQQPGRTSDAEQPPAAEPPAELAVDERAELEQLRRDKQERDAPTTA